MSPQSPIRVRNQPRYCRTRNACKHRKRLCAASTLVGIKANNNFISNTTNMGDDR